MTLQEQNRRTLFIAISAAVILLLVFGTCAVRARAQTGHPWPDPYYEAKTDQPAEALTDTTSVLTSSGQDAAHGQVERGQGLGGDSSTAPGSGTSELFGGAKARGEPSLCGSPSPQSRDPFSVNWLEAEYQFDSRDGESNRILSLEGHKRASERVDVYGSLDLLNGVDDDLARFTLRAGVFGRFDVPAGLAFWYEDFTGSENERGLLGFYYDALRGGNRPFVRLVALPVSTHDGGVMARVMFDAALHERWTLAGFLEGTWGGEDGSYDAAEPELRYLLTKGIWATLEYRRDERWGGEAESLALGLRAAL